MSQDVQTGLIAGTWTIDLSHSEAGFSVRHLMSKVRGNFTEFSGTITTAEDILASSVEVTIQSSSITTHNEQRDAHLRSADFFDPTKGGELHFVSTKITEDGDGGYVITGDLTINGITKSVDLAAEFLGVASDPWGQTKLGAEATTSINRKDFDVSWNQVLEGGKFLVGDKVDITLAVQATKA
jgi:polyisoprenoid-binding protein YceI